jgi:hypothetical protein
MTGSERGIYGERHRVLTSGRNFYLLFRKLAIRIYAYPNSPWLVGRSLLSIFRNCEINRLPAGLLTIVN